MIKPVQNVLYNNTGLTRPAINSEKSNISDCKSLNLNNLPSYKYQISFGKNDEKSIQQYLKQREQKLKKENTVYQNLDSNDLKHIEGIQKGIKVFENLSMPQINFIAQTLTEVVTQRGCNNMCVHCYAEAMPPSHQKSTDKINKISFEDFDNFCNGFKELNKRLGFNIFQESKNSYKTLFHDSDSAMIFLEDKNGKTYDYLDLAKKLNEATDNIIVFDTAGWNIQDKKTQKRMEELVEKALNSDEYDFVEFNISANPFHALYSRSLKHHNENNPEKEQKFRDIYTTRMANVLFTLSPLTEKNKINLITRALPDDSVNAEGYRKKDFVELYNEIIKKLANKYKENLENGNKKVIKDEEQIKKYLMYYKSKLLFVQTDPSVNGRLANIVTDKKSFIYKKSKDEEFNNPLHAAQNFGNGILDINGKYYATNWYETYKTDILLNYNNKDKKTADISPNLRKKPITKNMLHKIND